MELYARAAVAVVYQSLRVGIAVAGLCLHDVEGVAGGTGQLADGAGLHH